MLAARKKDMNQQKMTLKSVAALLGVSTATISNAFNRPDQLSETLRNRILSECKKLGYHGPNLAARSLRRGVSDVVGVLLSDQLSYYFTDPVANQFLAGITEVLEKHNKQLLLLSGAEAKELQSGIESLPDGFIVYGAQENYALFQRILSSGKPFITVDFDYEKHGSVNIDNYQSAYDIAGYMFDEGAQHPAIIGLRLTDEHHVCRIAYDHLFGESESISRRRLDGYLAAAKDHNLKIDRTDIWQVPINNHEYATQAASEVLSGNELPDSILCMSDVIASAVLSVAQSKGIQVPEQLKVVGFDDIPEAARLTPSLTTVSQYSKEKGRLAAKKLLADEISEKIIMPTQVRVRQSA